jgi:hypothetical protein
MGLEQSTSPDIERNRIRAILGLGQTGVADKKNLSLYRQNAAWSSVRDGEVSHWQYTCEASDARTLAKQYRDSITAQKKPAEI